jgi:hypothetical protein
LLGERTQWFQRIRTTLFHHTPENLRAGQGRAFLQRLELPADARERIQIALAMIGAIDARWLHWSASCVGSRAARGAAGR